MKFNGHLPINYPLSMKRKEDVTVEELKSMPGFAEQTDEELTAIIETVKIFSRAIIAIHARQSAEQKRTKKTRSIPLNPNLKKKAA